MAPPPHRLTPPLSLPLFIKDYLRFNLPTSSHVLDKNESNRNGSMSMGEVVVNLYVGGGISGQATLASTVKPTMDTTTPDSTEHPTQMTYASSPMY